MNRRAKIAIVSVALLVPMIALASKAKNALSKITFRITGFQILGFTAGGLKVRFRSEFINDTGQSFSASDLLSKLLYKEGEVSSEFARAANIDKVAFVHAVPKTIDSIFTIDLMQIPKLFKTDTFRVATFYTVLGIEQTLNYDIKITDLKTEVVKLVTNATWVPKIIKNLTIGKQPVQGYQAQYFIGIDLDPSQYQVV